MRVHRDMHELNDLLEKAKQGHTEDDRIAEQIFAYLIERHLASGFASEDGNSPQQGNMPFV